jgi:hypothetical protein
MEKTEIEYEAEQEYYRFQGITQTQEYLTQEEYDFVSEYDPTGASGFVHVGTNNESNRTEGIYLNLGLSEAIKDGTQY